MAVCSIPNKHSAVKLITAGEEKSIVMGETKKYNFVIMLAKSIDWFLSIEIPTDDVRVFSALT